MNVFLTDLKRHALDDSEPCYSVTYDPLNTTIISLDWIKRRSSLRHFGIVRAR